MMNDNERWRIRDFGNLTRQFDRLLNLSILLFTYDMATQDPTTMDNGSDEAQYTGYEGVGLRI